MKGGFLNEHPWQGGVETLCHPAFFISFEKGNTLPVVYGVGEMVYPKSVPVL